MKTVTYMGQEYLVPDDHKYIAADPSGAVYSFYKKPKQNDAGIYKSSMPYQRVGNLVLPSYQLEEIK